MTAKIDENISLREYTTFNVGGPAEYFCEVQDLTELREAVQWAKEHDSAITILGGGSNVLVSDNGVRGLVIRIALKGVEYKEAHDAIYVHAWAGEDFDVLVENTIKKKIWGLENLSRIPGSVGATPIQNVGAYGVEVSELISSVVAYDMHHDEFVVFSNNECGFRYRHSFFKRKESKQYVVVLVTFKLSKEPKPTLHYKDLMERFPEDVAAPSLDDIRDAITSIRAKKFPDWVKVGTAGSFFKNPIISDTQYARLKHIHPDLPGFFVTEEKVKIPLGWVLEWVLSLKGYRGHNVGTYEGQALVLINYANATAEEIQTFARMIEAKVKDETGIDVEWEVTKLS